MTKNTLIIVLGIIIIDCKVLKRRYNPDGSAEKSCKETCWAGSGGENGGDGGDGENGGSSDGGDIGENGGGGDNRGGGGGDGITP